MSWLDSFKDNKRQQYLNKIFENSFLAANTIKELSQDEETDKQNRALDDNQWFAILCEFLFFHLHLTDRIAFDRMDEEKRSSFMTELETVSISAAVDAVCQQWSEDDKRKIKGECWENFVTSVQYYSKFQRWFPKHDEPIGDTLFWEFGKVIAELAGHKNEISYIMICPQIMMDFLKGLEIQAMIEDER